MRLRLLLALLLLAPSLAVRAQPRGEPPTAGVAIPAGVLAGEAEATAVALDAANLTFLPSWSIEYLHTELDPQGTRGGRGDGLYLASRVPYLSWLAFGTAIELVRPPVLFPYPSQAKFSLAGAVRPLPGRSLSFGASYAHTFGGEGGPRLDTLDLSVTGRVDRHLALALVVHDVTSPAFRGLGLQRVYEPELALRPLGDSRWELGFAVRIGERRGDVDPRLRLEIRPWRGLVLRGALELKRDIDGDGRPENDLRATAGVEFNFERVGVGGYALFGRDTGGGSFHGWSITARISGDRYPALVLPRRLERIDLKGGGDRQHLARLHYLRTLIHRPRIDGVLLVLGDLSGGWARMEELRRAITDLRAAGLHVYAYGIELNTKTYFVGSAAEKLWVDPAGGIRLVGLGGTATYFRGTFDKLGVNADFIKIAEYKTAPEQYTRTGPSEEAQRVRQELLDDIDGRLVATLAAARHVEPAHMRELIDRGPYTAAESLAAGLVDGLQQGDQIEKAIGELLGHPVHAVRPQRSPLRPTSFAAPAIGVLHVEGDIVEGKSHLIPILDRKLVGHETLIRAILAARSDPRVRALLVRIDSPGGSALASELVWRELRETRKYKPVVCSLGDVAASGGYFIAAACDHIYASPSTITGSIGIFSGKFDVSGLARKLGVSWDTQKRGEHADIESYWRSYTEEERRLIESKLRYYYGRFVQAVSLGRGLKPEAVDAVGRGHVWTGAQAAGHHLVDRLGGFQEALEEAARSGGIGGVGLAPPPLLSFPAEEPTLLGEVLRLLGLQLPGVSELPLWGPALADVLRAIPASLWVAPSSAQARMEYELEWTP
ncbi:MAG TPA: signal peptide peptidase SppA [Polyangia bacterium]|nr:signal peptide peptidase SppA [Polyangia bacterium]